MTSLPMHIVRYILLFDSRFVMRNPKKLIMINKLDLTPYLFLLNKPLIVPKIMENINYGYMVNFHNKMFKLYYTKLMVNDEIIMYRIVFEKIIENNTIWKTHYI
jgi:hypothetical protein